MPLIFMYGGGSKGRSGPRSAAVLRIFRLTRLTRLARIARVARLIRDIPSLNILFKATSLAVTSVSATLIFLGMGIYIFSIFFVQVLTDTEEGKEHFATV